MKTILCATDFSENAAAALKYAYTISKKMNSNLLVIHVFDFPTVLGTEVSEPFPHLEEDAYNEHNKKLERFCVKHLGNELDRINVRIEAIEDKSVVKGIISKANELEAGLLVVGMKGGSALRELVMGNTTKKLINRASCPVLAIPEHASHTQIETIVYATDFEEDDIDAISSLIKIAKPFDASIKVVHIFTENEHAGKMRMEGFKTMLNKRVDTNKLDIDIFLSEDIFETLRVYTGVVGADIIAMLERKEKSNIKKWFHRDLVKKMDTLGNIPLLSFNKTIS